MVLIFNHPGISLSMVFFVCLFLDFFLENHEIIKTMHYKMLYIIHINFEFGHGHEQTQTI